MVETASIIVEGDADVLALVVELSKRLGARVEPAKVPRSCLSLLEAIGA